MAKTQLSIDHPLNNLGSETLKSAVEASRGALIITDNLQPDNPIIYSNKAFTELTGYDMDEIIGKNCRFLQADDRQQSGVRELHQAVKSNQYLRTTLKNYRKDGTPFWNDLVITPVKNAKGATTHFIGMQLDITDRVLAEQRLHTKTHELEVSNAELEQFTYAVSHDLQEPLRMISSYLQLIMKRYEKTFDEDVVTFMNFAFEGAERLQSLIYDLLLLSRVATTEEKFKRISLKVPVDRALLNLKALIEDSKATVSVGDMPTLPMDAVQMTQLFQNLVSNGIKYHKKTVKPKITITAKQTDNAYVIRIQDNGIGIDKQYHERIFGVFQRLHTRAEYQGTGVGLAICSKIVDRHGGKIWVESQKGKGATFYISIPNHDRSPK